MCHEHFVYFFEEQNSEMASSRQSSEQGGDGNLSEAESDTSSVMGDTSSVDGSMKPPSPASREQLSKRMESLIQENRVLKVAFHERLFRLKIASVVDT